VKKLTALRFKNRFSSGFTLVELLIVMGLLGAIAMIVIAAINPIEQANRARDTRFKADGSQLISAIDRYFAVRIEFPWVTTGSVSDNDAAYGFISAGDQGVGVCGTDCTADGVLITNDELKSEFRNRDFIQNHTSTDNSKKIFIGKEEGTSESVYACFIPLSKSVRQKSCADGNVYTISETTGTRTLVDETSCSDTSANWVTNGWYICIPE
jgi:prepilin-type N-terminal cleavage/methylation domain-containing protein